MGFVGAARSGFVNSGPDNDDEEHEALLPYHALRRPSLYRLLPRRTFLLLASPTRLTTLAGRPRLLGHQQLSLPPPIPPPQAALHPLLLQHPDSSSQDPARREGLHPRTLFRRSVPQRTSRHGGQMGGNEGEGGEGSDASQGVRGGCRGGSDGRGVCTEGADEEARGEGRGDGEGVGEDGLVGDEWE